MEWESDLCAAMLAQPHPYLPVLATSGIETVVRLWSPPRDPEQAAAAAAAANSAEEDSPGRLVTRNQERMREGPQLLRGVNPRILQVRARVRVGVGIQGTLMTDCCMSPLPT